MFDEIDTATESEVFNVLGRYVSQELSLVEAAIELSIAPDVYREVLTERDIEIREPTKENLVQNAAKCLQPEDEGDGYVVSESDRLQLEGAVTGILERVSVDSEQFRISEQGLRRRVRQRLWDAKTKEEDTSEVFWEEMDDIQRVLGTQDRTRYKIVFPLNVLFSDVERPDEYNVLGETIHAISSDEWETYCELAYEGEQEKAEESGAVNRRNNLEHRFEGSPNTLERSGQTYWVFEIEAIDSRFAVNRCIETLGFLLGRINFALTRNQLEGMQMNSSVWNTRWMDLRLPFIYLVFVDDEYSYYTYSRDPTPRDPEQLFGHKADRYRAYLNETLPLNGDLNAMERRLVKAVRSFQAAVANTDREDAFLNYWRAAERLTLTSETDTTSTVVQRARTIAKTSNVVSQAEVRDKRNKLVHEGDSVEITTDDTNTVKDMLEELIMLYVDKASEWKHDDFLFLFEHGDKSEAALKRLELQRQTDINRINKIREMD